MTSEFTCGEFGSSPPALSVEDILAAMKSMSGFIDITPGDFAEIYRIAFRHAVDRLAGTRKVGEIMTRTVIFVYPDTPLIETARKMAESGISGVPVLDGENRVTGMISEKDFLSRMAVGESGSFMAVIARCLDNRGCVVLPMRGKTAADIMTTPAVTVTADQSVLHASQVIKDENINRLPVIGKSGQLSGIVTRSDLIHSFCSNLYSAEAGD